jgi:hypothetical protein
MMIQRLALAAGIRTKASAHSFRPTAITTYLQNAGKLEVAQRMAGGRAEGGEPPAVLHERLLCATNAEGVHRPGKKIASAGRAAQAGSRRTTIKSMGTPWWFTPLMTFAGVVFGGAVSLITAWLTLRYGLQAQLAVRRADAEAAAATALRTEKEKRYLAILQNVESLYANSPSPAGRAELLKNVREVWLLGDEELVRKMRVFLVDIAGKKEAGAREQLFGDVVLDMRKGLGLPTDGLSNEDFRFHSA